MGWHGKACRVIITPDSGPPEETVAVDTERDSKTPSQRLRAVLFVWWQSLGAKGNFDQWYAEKMEKIIDGVKTKLPEQ